MARGEPLDDGTAGGSTTLGDDTYADTYADTYDDTAVDTPGKRKGNPLLKKLFASCEEDALGSVHRAWAVTVLFMTMFFITAIIEGECVCVCKVCM